MKINSRNTTIALTILSIVYLALRLWGITSQSLWLDEIKTLQTAELPMFEIIKERAGAGHFPLYFIFMSGWCSIFGISHLALRIPSLVGSFLTILAVAAMARRIFPRNGWLWFVPVVFFAINSFDITNSHLVRPYSFVTAAAGWSAWLLLTLLTDEDCRARRSILYVIVNLIGLALHPTFALLLLVQMGVLLAVRGRTASERNWNALAGVQVGLVIVGCSALAYLASVQQTVDDTGLRMPDIERAIRRGGETLFGLFENTGKKSLYKYVTILYLIVITVLEIRGGKREGRSYARTAGVAIMVWLYSGILLLCLASISTEKITAASRYFSILLPVAPLLLALPLRRIASSKGKAAWFAVSLILIVIPTVATFLRPGDGLMEAIRFIQENRQHGDGVYVCSCASNPAAFEYYTDGAIITDCAPESVMTLDDFLNFIESIEFPRAWFFLYHCDGDGWHDHLGEYAKRVKEDEWRRVKVYLYPK